MFQNFFEHVRKMGSDETFEPRDGVEFSPTDAPAGSDEKLAVLKERIDKGLPLWHPNDRVNYDGLTAVVRPRE